ncbi:MAG: 50S ribosomal protein L24 [Candidatus Micrarchaeia archaeon]
MNAVQSSKPKKQRLFRYNASMHIRQHFAHAHISKELRQKLGIRKRNIQLRSGDTVKIMSGSMKGKTGKVHRIMLKNSKAEIEGITRKNARGKETFIPVSVSSLYITDLDMSDKRRSAKLGLAKAQAQEAKA